MTIFLAMDVLINSSWCSGFLVLEMVSQSFGMDKDLFVFDWYFLKANIKIQFKMSCNRHGCCSCCICIFPCFDFPFLAIFGSFLLFVDIAISLLVECYSSIWICLFTGSYSLMSMSLCLAICCDILTSWCIILDLKLLRC